MAQSVLLTDIDYETFIAENAVFFEMWKGALSHNELCKMNIKTRWLYIKQLNEHIKRKNEAMKNNNNNNNLDMENFDG